jgi:hypothetical protein
MLTADILDDALFDLPAKRRDGLRVLSGPFGEIHLHEPREQTSLHGSEPLLLEGILATFDSLGDAETKALTRFVGKLNQECPAFTFQLHTDRVTVTREIPNHRIEAELSDVLSTLRSLMRSLRREAQALLDPELAAIYERFFSLTG